jgi:hypothetical protein
MELLDKNIAATEGTFQNAPIIFRHARFEMATDISCIALCIHYIAEMRCGAFE